MSLRVKLEAKKTAVTRHYVAAPFCHNSRGVNCGILAILFHNHFPFIFCILLMKFPSAE